MPFQAKGGAIEQVTFLGGRELTIENGRVRNVPDREEEAVELQLADRIILGRAKLDAGEHVMAVLLLADHFLDDRIPGVGDLGILGHAILHDLGSTQESRDGGSG